ncbi:unnamed protein product [Urochloa humidicola]
MEADGGGASLPEDVIFAVLSWLSAKPLCRFRCVSKGWRALISSPAFIAAHRSRAANSKKKKKSRAAPLLVGVFVASSGEIELRVMDVDGNVLRVLRLSDVLRWYDFQYTTRYEKLLSTRLDLVCVDRLGDGAVVIDPATRGVVTVGRQVLFDGEPAVDLSKWHGQMNRFGRAAPSGTYKVTRLQDTFSGWSVDGQLCEVATLGDGDGGAEPAWRRRLAPPFLTCSCASCTATVNGVNYFLPRDACRHQILWNQIACFDVESEEWKETIRAPKLMRRRPQPSERLSTGLGGLKGTLCVVQSVRSCIHGYTNVDIWLLADPEMSIWVEEYKIHSPDSLFTVKPLEVMRDGRLLLLKTIEKTSRSTCILQLYDPGRNTFTDVKQMPKV